MIERYTTLRMKSLWSEQNKFQKWLDIELLACEAQAKLGKIPKSALTKIKKKAKFNVDRIAQIEEKTKHDVVAFLTNLAENIGREAKYVHYGMTSSDILDTSLSLLMREAGGVILQDLNGLSSSLKKRAFKFKDTPMIGRTHGVHAEPITLGLKFALWYAEVQRNIERLNRTIESISVGKISGAVGTFSNLDPKVEEYVCKRLKLKPASISSQIIQRDRHAEFMTALAIIASSIEKFATEIRSLQRTEILELEEGFAKGQKGSSAMPHKRNPITCERLCGLARLVRTNAQAALENITLWHERDISHSSVERVIIPDSTILVDYMLTKFDKIIENLLVYPENMKSNLEKTRGMIFSGRLLVELSQKARSKEEAYLIVQDNAMKAWNKNENFKDLIKNDKRVKKYLTDEEIDECFNLDYYLRDVDYIFKRVFGRKR
ncbi:MAG: adenylosuccinate lyase [candidate division Zixibacteria bacterium]|nr:adenylosuccinate lyase [candidate division Zixibacteria bacterium]